MFNIQTYRRRIYLVLNILLCLFFLTCYENMTEIIDNVPAGRRDYTWTVDTLKASVGDMMYPISLWGSSPTDVWALGFADASNIAKWHYDGFRWTIDSSRISNNLHFVFGFSHSDVWAVEGPGDKVWHYDGFQWSMFGQYPILGYSRIGFNSIWGDSPDNMYAVGGADSTDGNSYKGIISHFNGVNWNYLNIPNIKIGFSWIRRDYSALRIRYYLMGTRFERTGDSVKIFEFNGITLKQIYADVNGSLNFNLIDNRIYFSDTRKILTHNDSVFTVWKDFSSSGYRFGTLYGRSYKDIFMGGYNASKNALLHYDGNNLLPIHDLPQLTFHMFLFPSDIFVLGHNGTYPIILHGKLTPP